MKIIKSALITGTLLAFSLEVSAKVISINSLDQYNKLHQSEKPLVTMYSASWCGGCRYMKPYFERAAESYPDISFCIVNVDSMAKLSSGIRSIPTTIFSHRGKKVMEKVGGMDKNGLDSSLESFKQLLNTPLVKKTATKRKRS